VLKILDLRNRYYGECSDEINNYLKELLNKRKEGDFDSIFRAYHLVCERSLKKKKK
jgi:hypothetical protein